MTQTGNQPGTGGAPFRPKLIVIAPAEAAGRDYSSMIWDHGSFHSGADVRIALLVRRPSSCGIDHIDRAAIPGMFERKRHDFPDTDESQPEFHIPAQILEPGLRKRFKSNLVALTSNECDKCLLDVERGGP